MKFSVNQQDLQKALNYCQGVVEKRNTLPILSNILLDAKNSKLTITATDLDLIFVTEIEDIEIHDEGNTTTTASILYDIIRKFSSGKKINFSFSGENKIQLESEKSVFHLNCIKSSEFPITDENFNANQFNINAKSLLKLMNKCKFSISNDETRHYLSGIFLHQTQIEDKNFLTAVSTDSHRMSISKVRLNEKIEFEPIILPKKTIFQLISLLEQSNKDIQISTSKSKIKFEMENGVLISKVIDGRFPDYTKVIPKDNDKILEIKLDEFKNSIDRVTSVSSDRKEGLRMSISNNAVQFSVNSPQSGEGIENIKAKFNSNDLNISFNSRYLIDIASQIEHDSIIINLKDSGSPVLIKDFIDKNSFHVVMPMKI